MHRVGTVLASLLVVLFVQRINGGQDFGLKRRGSLFHDLTPWGYDKHKKRQLQLPFNFDS